MAPKRRASGRVTRDTPKKKKEESPVKEATPVEETPPTPEPPPKPALPVRIEPGKTLPTVERHRTVPEASLQSLTESAVLVASLQRSRIKWLGEGLFQRYWTKPTKKKGQVVEPPNNPSKDTMHKIGTCQIMIDPHSFEAIVYSIRDPNMQPPPAPMMPARTVSQFNTPFINQSPGPHSYMSPSPNTPQTGSPNLTHASHLSNFPANAPQWNPGSPYTHALNSPVAATPPAAPSYHSPTVTTVAMNVTTDNSSSVPPHQGQSVPASSSPANTSTPSQAPASAALVPPASTTSNAISEDSLVTQTSTVVQPPNPPFHHQSPAPISPAHTPVPNHPPVTNTQVAPKPSQDPVIQMLAQRAATNPKLKILMKIVAAGEASTEQLQTFQGHIDELTAILHERRQAAEAQLAQAQAAAAGPPPQAAQRTIQPVQNPAQIGARPTMNVLAAKPISTSPAPPMYYISHPPAKPKPYITPKLDITGIAFEFVSGSGDRFLFPRHCVLEFIPQLRQVMVSFLVTRKGSEVLGSNYEPDTEYYQPVTFRVSTDQPKVMETVSRAVATYDEATRHMSEVMARAKRAEDVHLSLRLPREQEEEKEEIEEENEDGTTGTGAVAPSTETIAAPFLERRKAFKSLMANPASAGSFKSAPTRPDPWEENCTFCYSALDGSTALFDGKAACRPCAVLRAREQDAKGRKVVIESTTKQHAGLQTLCLAV